MEAPGAELVPPALRWTNDAVTVADRWTYVWGARRRPHLHPVTTPAGVVLTRDAPDDHPWHHGLWFTIKFVDGDNFWEEVPPYGVLRHDGTPTAEHLAGGSVALTGAIRWVRPDRETVAIDELRSLSHVPLGADAYAIDLDTRLRPTAAVRLDRTEFTTWGGYGGLTLRGPSDLSDTVLRLDDGTTHERVLGVGSTWCDLTGEVTDHGTPPGPPTDVATGLTSDTLPRTAGLAMFDHPGNLGHPVPFYASTRAETYGDDGWSNFMNAAFLWNGPVDLAADEELRIRHRVVVHDGAWSTDRLHAEWTAWSAT